MSIWVLISSSSMRIRWRSMCRLQIAWDCKPLHSLDALCVWSDPNLPISILEAWVDQEWRCVLQRIVDGLLSSLVSRWLFSAWQWVDSLFVEAGAGEALASCDWSSGQRWVWQLSGNQVAAESCCRRVRHTGEYTFGLNMKTKRCNSPMENNLRNKDGLVFLS